MKKYQIVIIGIVLICCIIGAVFYLKEDFFPSPKPAKPSKPTVSSNMVQYPTPIFPTPVIPSMYSYSEPPSPFASIPTDLNNSASNDVIPVPTPRLPNGGANLTNYSLKPDTVSNFGSTGMTGQVEIIALIPSANNKGQAILSSGSQQVIVTEGEHSQWGLITNITAKGLTLNGNYITIDPKQISRSDANRVPMIPFPQIR